MKCPKCHFENPDDTLYCGKCATPLRPSEEISAPTKTLETPKEELTRGTTLAGRYEIIEELGKGGMGSVYRVEDKKTKEELALKLIKPEIAADKKTIERFSNELKIAHKISHKNVCRMYHLDEEKGKHFITMEYVPGEDLKSLIRRVKQLTVGTAISMAKEVCEGLAEAHRLGVVHRDLKPSNIMVDKEGNTRIMDFGIARSLEAKGITAEGMIIGTPEYMSPEQVEGKEADKLSDIYSLGVILYEMLTGRVPFEGDTPLSIAYKHKHESPRDPRKINYQIPEDLNSLILKCMEKDKENRYQSAREVHSELSRIEEGIPTTEKVISKRKSITAKEITVTFGLKKLFIPALVFIALVVIGVVIWQLLSQKETIPILTDKPSLAVIYFKNNTGDESLDHWRMMLSDLLIQDLFQSKYIRVLSEDRLLNILEELNQIDSKSYSSKVLKEVAVRGRVNHILQGNYAKAGDIFRVNVTLQDATTMELIASEGVEGEGQESIFSMVDELTRRVKTHFKLSEEEIASDIDREVGKITTSSSEAYKFYSEGMKYYNKGDYRQSIQSMERALAIDPEFAMAYRFIAYSYLGLNYRAKWKETLQKAMKLADRISDRESYLIEGDFYFQSAEEYYKSIEAYRKLLQLYPQDRDGNFSLGRVHWNLEQWDEAIERFEVLRQNNDELPSSYSRLAGTYMAKGQYDKAKEVLEYYLNNFSDDSVIHRRLANIYLCQGKYDLALIEIDKALSLDPTEFWNLGIKGHIYHSRGDLIEAEKEYQHILKTDEKASHLKGRGWLGDLYLLQGKFEKANDQFEHARELASRLGEIGSESGYLLRLTYTYLKSGNLEKALEESKRAERSSAEERGCMGCHRERALHLKGFTYLKMRSMDEAQKVADELNERIKKGYNRKYIRFYNHLIGVKEVERENFSKAIEYFKEAISMLPAQYPAIHFNDHALFIDALASAYYKAGDIEKARAEYEGIISLTSGRLYWGDIFAKSFYMLGKIYEEKGWKGKAIEHYEKFLDLWKDADPGIPEIEDAKEKLVALLSQK